MKVENNDIQTIPYSHHFRCFPQMVGSVANQAVFMYLMDEYIYRLKTERPTWFTVSIKDISQKRNVHRDTVKSVLENLQTMQLITIIDRNVTINADRYVSLIKAFNALSKTTDKTNFINALQKGDYVSLCELGYTEAKSGNDYLLQCTGRAFNVGVPKIVHPVQNCTDVPKIVHPQTDKYVQNCTGVYKIVHPQESEVCTKLYRCVQNCTRVLKEIRQVAQENFTKSTFVDEFGAQILEFLDEKELEDVVELLFSDKEPENVIFGANFGVFIYFWGCTILGTRVYNFRHGGVQKCTPVNNINNINKKERSRNFVPGSKEDKKEDIFEVEKEGLDKSISSYRNLKKKNSLPFFPANKVQEYISDIRNCLDRADKIFINQVWEIAHECLDQEAILDEDGNEQLPANSEIENCGIAKERLRKDILLPAFDKTQEIIEAGSIEVNGELYPVTAILEHPEDLENIIDWELHTLLDGDNYIVSTKRVRNIFGEQVEQPSPRSAKRSNREDDMSYMQKIIQIGDDDARYSQLTPIELMVYNFLATHFQIGESGEIEEPLHHFVNRTTLGIFYLDAKTMGVSESDFVGVISNDKPDGNGNLNLRQRMFSADKIRSWNKLHSYSSIVDQT